MIYLDYNATAPIRPQVIDVVSRVMGEVGNASSLHRFGSRARNRVETARKQVANLVNVQPNQVIFNSSATEANNTILHGFTGQRILLSAIEHPSLIKVLPDKLFETIPVTSDGIVNLNAFSDTLHAGHPPALISVMMVNSETGAIQPVKEIAEMAREAGAIVHCDAVQAAGRVHIDMPDLGVHFMTLAAHKIGGPQGVGALIMSPGAPTPAFLRGGGQERMQRAGTENVAGIAGFGLAAELAAANQTFYATLREWHKELETKIKDFIPEVTIFADTTPRSGNTTCMALPGISAQTQLMAMDLEGIAISSGSACSSGSVKHSHVLKAMGATVAEQDSAIRISSGWDTKKEDLDIFFEKWKEMVQRLHGNQEG